MDDIERIHEYNREMAAENAEFQRAEIKRNVSGALRRSRNDFPFPVMVVTRDQADPDTVTRTVIDYNNIEHRQWLGKHSYWALKNNHSVTTHQTTEAITFKVKVRKTYFRKE